MSDAVELLKTLKKAAVEAVDATKPVQVCYGKVTGTSPLKILVDQKLTLGEGQLVLTRNVTDYQMDISVSHWTVAETKHTHPVTSGGTATATSHRHQYKGRKKITVHNALQNGDAVVLIREQGGQKYIVIDRIKPIPNTEGEWV